MSIRTKLRIGTIVTTTFIITFIAAIFLLTFNQQQLFQKGQITEEISETAFQLSVLRSEYLVHPGKRPKTQWINMYEVQSRLLDESAHVFVASKEKVLLEEIRSASVESRILFGELVSNIEQSGNQTVREELNNQMTLKEQTRVSAALRLASVSHDVATDARQAFMLALILLGALVVGISILSYNMNTGIADSIHALGEGSKNIARGDLNYQLSIRSNDEVGEMAQLFNTMAMKLKESHGALEQKVEDRTREISTILRALDNVALVSMTDAKGDITYANDKFVEVSKYSREELIGQNHRMLKSGQQPQSLFIELWNTISSGKVWRGEIMNRSKDGTMYWVDTSIASVLDAHGKPERYISVRFLITERKRADRAKSEFIALASHQLRTPLTEIRWALSSLSREAMEENQKRIIEKAHSAATHMAETIKTMLTISNIEAGKMHPNSVTVSVREALDTAITLYALHGSRKALKVTLECPNSLTLHTDPKLLQEILSNLISNAYKYTPHEGSVRIKAEQLATDIRISIIDTGCGIPRSEQSLLFTKFFRASNVIDTKEEGSGIGLYMVYALTTLLGGTISCTSEEKKGTTFTLIFPQTV